MLLRPRINFSSAATKSLNTQALVAIHNLFMIEQKGYRVLDEKLKQKRQKEDNTKKNPARNEVIEPEILYEEPKINIDNNSNSNPEKESEDSSDDERFFGEKCAYSELIISADRFDSKNRLLIIKHPNGFFYSISILLAVLSGVTVYFFLKYNSLRKISKESSDGASSSKFKKYLYLSLGILSTFVLLPLCFNSNIPVKRLYLMKDGRTLNIKYLLYSETIDIKHFTKLVPGKSTKGNFDHEDYEDAIHHGYPVLINQTMKMITYSTVIYEKAILKEIGRNKYFKIL